MKGYTEEKERGTEREKPGLQSEMQTPLSNADLVRKMSKILTGNKPAIML